MIFNTCYHVVGEVKGVKGRLYAILIPDPKTRTMKFKVATNKNDGTFHTFNKRTANLLLKILKEYGATEEVVFSKKVTYEKDRVLPAHVKVSEHSMLG